MFRESLSFAAGAVAGSLIIKGGMALMAVATPVGWVGLLFAGAIVAGGVVASVTTNNALQKYADTIYDDILAWLYK